MDTDSTFSGFGQRIWLFKSTVLNIPLSLNEYLGHSESDEVKYLKIFPVTDFSFFIGSDWNYFLKLKNILKNKYCLK